MRAGPALGGHEHLTQVIRSACGRPEKVFGDVQFDLGEVSGMARSADALRGLDAHPSAGSVGVAVDDPRVRDGRGISSQVVGDRRDCRGLPDAVACARWIVDAACATDVDGVDRRL